LIILVEFEQHTNNLVYSRAKADPPHPFIKGMGEEGACEGVVFYVEQAASKSMP
jgi:hypothetical protein